VLLPLRLAEKERRRDSFAIETTLSSTMSARHMRSWRAAGYIEVPSEEFAVRRVATRDEGGLRLGQYDEG